MTPRFTIALAILGLLLSACGAPANPSPATNTPAVTRTLASPTLTPEPSRTPTATGTPTGTPTQLPTATPSLTPTPEPAVLSGAGDVSECGGRGDNETAALLASLPGEIFIAGDADSGVGAPVNYTQCFDASWGQLKDRIHPSPGNHDYSTSGGAGYYGYFGAAAGDPSKGYYSYNLGAWHIVALNSNCNEVGCGEGSQQLNWLKADLEAHPAKCTLAYWHHPRFSSGLAGSAGMFGFWKVLYDYGADVVLNGNDHDYERFAPQDPTGRLDEATGIREFVVGTGGASMRGFGTVQPNSEARISGTYGVIKLTLYSDRYDWEYLTVDGGVRDSGTGQCH